MDKPADIMAPWQAYLTRLFQSVKLPPEHKDEDIIVGTAHGIDAAGIVQTSPVVRRPNGRFDLAEPLHAVYRFRLPGR